MDTQGDGSFSREGKGMPSYAAGSVGRAFPSLSVLSWEHIAPQEPGKANLLLLPRAASRQAKVPVLRQGHVPRLSAASFLTSSEPSRLSAPRLPWKPRAVCH